MQTPSFSEPSAIPVSLATSRLAIDMILAGSVSDRVIAWRCARADAMSSAAADAMGDMSDSAQEAMDEAMEDPEGTIKGLMGDQ